MIEIIKNYLAEETFNQVYNNVQSLPWAFKRKMNENSTNENQFQFLQDYSEAYYDNRAADSFARVILSPYLNSFSQEKSVEVIRVRTNLFIRTSSNKYGGGFHTDLSSATNNHFTLLLYLEDSNGATEFKKSGRKVISERNKAVIFPCSLEHQTLSQTDVLFRFNININFKLI